MRDGFYLDANLLVLLVAGSTKKALITKHRRLQGYTVQDYDISCRIIESARELFVTPNTLTEASNLLAQHADPERSDLRQTLRSLIEKSIEIVISSKEATSHDGFVRLGLTDVALLKAVSSKRPLLTVDLDLYLAAIEGGEERAINFNHHRF